MRMYCGSCMQSVIGTTGQTQCPSCMGNLYFEYDKKSLLAGTNISSIWKYFDFLPVVHKDYIVSLGEGTTPLLRSNQSFQSDVYWKDETKNPTGSMKDRALSVAFSKAKELGVKQTIIASTGSAGISASAYAARGKINNTVLVPEGTPTERLIAMHMLGSRIIEVNATIEELVEIIETAKNELGWMDVSTYRKGNPYQSEAPKTIAYEVFEQLGCMPEFFLVPVGGGGTFSGIWNGFKDLVQLGLAKEDDLPKMIAVHHVNYNSLEKAMEEGLSTDQELLELATRMDNTLPCIAKNIQHTYCMDGEDALIAIRESSGFTISVGDEEILQAQKQLARFDGIFAEPTSASVLAGLIKLEAQSKIEKGSKVVALISGSGLRETQLAIRTQQLQIPKVKKTECIDFFRNSFQLME